MAFPESAGPTGPLVARLLLELGAVHLRPKAPFTLTSGRQSPVYVDCRKIISYPLARSRLTMLAAQMIEERIGFAALDVIAGGETAGIPYAAWIADRLGLPMCYIRKKPKGFGRDSQIEGSMPEDARVLLVEDLATDGGSKRVFVEAIRGAGAAISHALVIFHYGIFPQSRANMEALGINLHALATWRDVYDTALEQDSLTAEDAQSVRAFLENPEAWRP
ncbi:MAG TPA: orotate phosphoribosyltransferase [Dongiaceae bacterium]|jgi:orotate phosphoribosyltransferase|nr:orotate phosphoribosyltransferase [Dongiaceae bacterium]